VRSSPLKRSRKPLRRQSKRRRAEQPARDRCERIACRRAKGFCEACTPVCTGLGHHGHERRKASSGGSRTNPRNVLWCCNSCNGWVEDFPIAASMWQSTCGLSLVVREGDPEFPLLGKRRSEAA
jgi:hypothetical protein